MKKTLIALAALAVIGSVSAQTTTGAPGFQITGNFNGGFVANSYKGNTANGFEQNGMGTSQIMFRGLEDLGGGLSAYFLHDTDIQFATNRGDTGVVPGLTAATSTLNNKGTASTFGNDQKMVGMRGSFGDIAIGTINNSALYNYVVLVSPVAGTSYGSGYALITAANPTMGAVRWDNTIQYKTPVISGFQGTVQYVAKQTPQGAAASVTAPINYSPALGATNVDGVVELSGRYSNGPLTVAYTNQRTDGVQTSTFGTIGTLSALGAAYDISPAWKVTAGVETITVSAAGDVGAKAVDRSNYMTGVFYTTGASTFWSQYGSLTENAAGAKNGKTTTMASVGFKYALSKMTAVEARYERADDQAGVIVMPGSLVMLNNDTVRTRSTVGVNLNF